MEETFYFNEMCCLFSAIIQNGNQLSSQLISTAFQRAEQIVAVSCRDHRTNSVTLGPGINIHLRLVCGTRTERRKPNTSETKGDNRQTKPNICWVVNSVCPGERKLVGCCVALFLQRWIPARLTRTLNEHKTTLCDCWLLCGLISKLWKRTSEPQICWNSVGIVSRTHSIREITSESGLDFPPCQQVPIKWKVTWLFSDLLLWQQQIKKPQSALSQHWRLTVHYIMCNMHKKKFDSSLSLHFSKTHSWEIKVYLHHRLFYY